MLIHPTRDLGLILGQPRAEFKNYDNNYFFIKLTRVNIQGVNSTITNLGVNLKQGLSHKCG